MQGQENEAAYLVFNAALLASLLYRLLMAFAVSGFFVAIFGLVLTPALEGIDRNVAKWMWTNAGEAWRPIMLLIGRLTSPKPIGFAALLVVGWLIWRGKFVEALVVGLTVCLALRLYTWLQVLFHRRRPARPGGGLSGDSFPSGHAFLAAAFWGLLAFLALRELRSPVAHWFVLATTISVVLITGFSRIYLALHYVTDVLAGFLGGALLCAGAILVLHTRGL